MEVGGRRYAPAALPSGKNRYLLYRRMGGPQGPEILASTGIRSPDRPASSESLYRLRYSDPYIYIYIYICYLEQIILQVYNVYSHILIT